MPAPDDDIGQPAAHADGANVRTRVPVRCETGQRRAEMHWREAYQFASAIMRACGEAEAHEYNSAAGGH